ncbi:MAG: prepilin-type N-terminal cleavage/methylation domain-containing protein [Pseudomonadota bacterium]|nr:prepilin-type N-terminal cleavage/methylation domain-containing protein [Pseudomonadota bacterium]
MASCANAGGFTLIELVVTLTLLMLLSAIVATGFSPWLAFQQALETDQRLAAQQQLWMAWLERHAGEVEQAGADPGLALGERWLADGTLLDAASWQLPLSAALGAAGPALVEDGFHQPWRMHVSRSLLRDERGIALHYHVLALVSPGANGRIEPATRFDAATGLLLLAGDDRGVLIDGWPLARQQLERLDARLERAGNAWQDWFRARWEGDAERDPSIDYFAGPCPGDPLASAWDGGPDALPPSCDAASDPAAPGLRLGLSIGELRDPTGAPLHFDANSAATRNPDQADPGLRIPPYSAMVSGGLPGGTRVQRSVLGTL